MNSFNVREYGASGSKAEDARPAIQKAIDACAQAGGGMVYLPPGEYTSGTLHLRSHVRFHIEAGATLYSSKDPSAYTWQDHRASLFYGEDLENITLEGRGVVDGQAAYEWRPNDLDDRYIIDHQRTMEALGKPLTRPFPTSDSIGRLVLLLRCRDVRIEGLSFVRSPSWTINPYACERLVIDGVYIATSLKEGVWADGIDPDGCRDVRIANCTIETGDDAIVFYSSDVWGPALPCENITVTNCRLSSASSALKFCDGNKNCVRSVTVDNCVITNSNRGIAFMTFDGGYVSDVVISNLTIECRRFDWFWWGDGDPIHFMVRRRIRELHPELEQEEPPAGAIRNVLITNVLARGKGTSLLHGHPESWLEEIRLENVRLFLSADPNAPFEHGGHALRIERARNVTLEDVEVVWEDHPLRGRCPPAGEWRSAVSVEEAEDLVIDGFRGRQALPEAGRRPSPAPPAIALDRVAGALVRNCRAAPGTGTFLGLAGRETREICLANNDLRHAQTPHAREEAVPESALRDENNL
jgi:Glycosyl hydrolases family 28